MQQGTYWSPQPLICRLVSAYIQIPTARADAWTILPSCFPLGVPYSTARSSISQFPPPKGHHDGVHLRPQSRITPRICGVTLLEAGHAIGISSYTPGVAFTKVCVLHHPRATGARTNFRNSLLITYRRPYGPSSGQTAITSSHSSIASSASSGYPGQVVVSLATNPAINAASSPHLSFFLLFSRLTIRGPSKGARIESARRSVPLLPPTRTAAFHPSCAWSASMLCVRLASPFSCRVVTRPSLHMNGHLTTHHTQPVKCIARVCSSTATPRLNLHPNPRPSIKSHLIMTS
ncbi:uncharacterized protein LY79DRAFT_386217 [Colletotrichum navitas]|uniref:Uncharacterized protein n=1 Tax=Colletotrichum navitas TaxID=681940 RepID=A0AAD8V901_9PEZI|nr:uncharacterized protein LY79DRAFT_386217 [Colletotrichum navitas]KAK1597454.1 hypothetical protein LY79DRAFT_386217 [Colletotrichum navitas]